MIGLKTLAIAALAVASLQGSVLKRILNEGDTTKYEVKCTRTSESEQGGAHTMSASWNASYTLGKVDSEKGADLTVKIENFKLDAEFQMPQTPPATRTASATVTPKGAIVQKEPNTPNTTGGGWLTIDYIELPNADVTSWDMTLPKSMGFGEKVSVKAKLDGEQEIAGKKAWKVKIEAKDLKFSNPVQVRFGSADSPVREGKVSGTASLTVEALVDKANGSVLSLTQKVHRVQTLELEGADMEQPEMTIDDVATMKIKS